MPELSGEAGALAEFSCGATAVTIRGSVLNPVSPNKRVLTVTVKWNATVGKQKPDKFEGLPQGRARNLLGEAPVERSALKLTTIQTSEERSRSTRSSEQPMTRSP